MKQLCCSSVAALLHAVERLIALIAQLQPRGSNRGGSHRRDGCDFDHDHNRDRARDHDRDRDNRFRQRTGPGSNDPKNS